MVRIDLHALQNNIDQIKSLAPKSKLLAIVKDNAYGHGIETVLKTICADAEGFGVISLKEALKVREYSLSKPIVLMQGVHTSSDLAQCVDSHITVLIHNIDQIKILNSINVKKKIKFWIKINCGLNRLGFKDNELDAAFVELKKLKHIDYDNVCIMSHLSSADSSTEISKKEIDTFSMLTKNLPFEKSLASSAAILNYPEIHYDWIRPGLLMYGICPLAERTKSPILLKPVMSLEGSIIALYQLGVGEGVGYSGTWTCERPTKVAIVNVGYADGYPFHIGKDMSVLINKTNIAQIIGKVSSDAMAIDVTDCKNAKIGDTVTLWGRGLPVEDVARQANTIPDQLLCAVGQRYIP